MKAVVWQLLDRLSPRKRMVLVLCDLEGHTLEEAAKQMDIPVGTAASRLFHARQDFQKAAIAEFRRQGLEIGDWLASSKK
jgi:RNA polymerase sigma factor (sigma-70 family)